MRTKSTVSRMMSVRTKEMDVVGGEKSVSCCCRFTDFVELITRIYLDMCSLQRPLDKQSQLRVVLETQAILGVLALCEAGLVELIASDVLVFEAEASPDAVRRNYSAQVIAKATEFVQTNELVKRQAQEFVASGIKPLDALHLASAIAAQANYFCTCDDRFLKKARSLGTAPTRVVSPVELVAELET